VAAQAEAAAAPSSSSSSSSLGPGPHYLATTSVGSSVAALAAAAVSRLKGGMRLAAPGGEEGRVTHLVVGAERRTLKVGERKGGGVFGVWKMLVWVSHTCVCVCWHMIGGFCEGANGVVAEEMGA
jgi:hypothetical protein